MDKRLTVVVVGGFLIGELVGNKLLKPRVMTFNPEKSEIHMAALPFTPMQVTVAAGGISYPVPKENKSVYELYDRVTDPVKIRETEDRLRREQPQPSIMTGRN